MKELGKLEKIIESFPLLVSRLTESRGASSTNEIGATGKVVIWVVEQAGLSYMSRSYALTQYKDYQRRVCQMIL